MQTLAIVASVILAAMPVAQAAESFASAKEAEAMGGKAVAPSRRIALQSLANLRELSEVARQQSSASGDIAQRVEEINRSSAPV